MYNLFLSLFFYFRTVHLILTRFFIHQSLTLASTDNGLPEDDVTTPKHVAAILM